MMQPPEQPEAACDDKDVSVLSRKYQIFPSCNSTSKPLVNNDKEKCLIVAVQQLHFNATR